MTFIANTRDSVRPLSEPLSPNQEAELQQITADLAAVQDRYTEFCSTMPDSYDPESPIPASHRDEHAEHIERFFDLVDRHDELICPGVLYLSDAHGTELLTTFLSDVKGKASVEATMAAAQELASLHVSDVTHTAFFTANQVQTALDAYSDTSHVTDEALTGPTEAEKLHAAWIRFLRIAVDHGGFRIDQY